MYAIYNEYYKFVDIPCYQISNTLQDMAFLSMACSSHIDYVLPLREGFINAGRL